MDNLFLLSSVASVICFVAIIGYFKVAEKYNIIDKPNERSSHVTPTIRGGGIIFVFAMLFYAITNQFQPLFFLLGFFAIAIVSFIDDVKSLSNRWRLSIHFISIVLLIYQITMGEIPIWLWGIGLVVAIGIVNAYNFMDGINGITGLYSLVFFGSMLFLQQQDLLQVPIAFLILPIVSLIVFNFFNVRKKARCFAGDVGSVSIAFIVIYLIGLVCWQQNTWIYIWLLAIYGADSVLTIIQRLYLKQNIFKAHRLHLYQLMANEAKVPHIQVSVLYAILQLIVNGYLFLYAIPQQQNPWITTGIFAAIILAIYIPSKLHLLKLKP